MASDGATLIWSREVIVMHMHGDGLEPLSWSTFFHTWQLEPGWFLVCGVLAGAYLICWWVVGASSTVRPWRAACFVAGCALLWTSLASAIGAYAMSVFWMHMVLHLTLIMVVPALLVLGHPLTVLLESLHGPARERFRRMLGSRPAGVLTNPFTGLLVYSVTIIGTHLTGFMDQMARHGWLMTAEQVLYVVAGWLFLLPLIGEEPLRYRPPYLLRMVLLVVAMVPDTIVGIVLLQASTVPFPVMMAAHPAWAPPALADIQIGGGLMWAAGDGLMMFIAVGLMISVLTSRNRQQHLVGSWLERARVNTLSEQGHNPDEHGWASNDQADADSDQARDAYNRMLHRLNGQD